MVDERGHKYEPCKCRDPLIRIYFGETDVRYHEGVHSMRRCIKRKPVGTTCKCGLYTSYGTGGYTKQGKLKDGRVGLQTLLLGEAWHIPWIVTRRKWLAPREKRIDSFIAELNNIKQGWWRGIGPWTEWIHDVDGCMPLEKWRKS